MFPLIFILAIAGGLLAYVAIARYLSTNTLSEAFKFGEVIANLRSNLGPWLILLLVGILANFVGGLGLIACGVGVLFTSFYAQCVMGHALGQTIRQLGARQMRRRHLPAMAHRQHINNRARVVAP